MAIPNATPVTQNFDGLGASGTAALPTGFKVSSSNDYNNVANTTATTLAYGTTGTGAVTSTSSGGCINWANGITASATDRALGFLTTGSYASPRSIILAIQNTGTTNITDLTITFDYEKYRSGSRAFDWTFFHGATATAVNTAAAAGNQSYAADANNTTIYNPPTTTSKSVTLTGLTIAPSGLYYLCWTFTGVGGSSNGQGIGIDNLSITATFVSPGITTAQDGPWNVGTTWTGGVVPTSAQNAIINHVVTLDAAVTRNSGTTTTVNTGAKLATGAFTYTNDGTTTIDGTFELNGGGFANGLTNFTYGTASTLNFNTGGSYNMANAHVYWPATNSPKNVNIAAGTTVVMAADAYRTISTGGILSISGALTLTTNPTITVNGTLRLDAGGFLNTGAMPIYGNASTLLYNTGGTYGRGFEWNAAGVGTIGTTAGYPNHVQVSNSTTLNYINGAASGAVGSKAMAGNLTIDAGSAFHMNFGSVSAGGELVVAGNIANAGTLTLGFANGDDLRVTGNLTNTGTFNGNNRAVYFNKNGTQVVTSAAGITIPYLRTAGTATVVQLAAGTNMIISAPLTGNAVVFGSASDVIDINGNTLTIGTAAVANTVSGTGTFKGSTTSNLTLLGTGSIGTLYFTTGFQNLGTFTMNRQANATGAVMGSAVTVNTALTLTAGFIDLNNTTMTLAAGVNPSGSANSYVIADVSAGGVLRKNMTATGSQSFPIGSGGTEYSPVTFNLTAGTLSGAYLGISVENSKDPLLDALSIYLNRYWVVTSGGITAPTYTFTGTYLAADVVGGTIGNVSNQHNGTQWLNNGATIAGTVIINGTTLSGNDHYTAGRRDAEINIVQSATNYINGSIYNFGTVLTGSTLDVVFTIQNLGNQTLLLGATPTITGNPPYSLQANYASTSIPGMSGTTPNTQTFTIRFAPTAAGTFTGSISITNNDPTGAESPYVINFTGVGQIPAPEINVKGFTGGTNSITSGNVTTTSGLENTAFGSVNLGSNVTKDFEIQNLGTAVLTLSGAPLVSIGGTNPGDFVVTTAPATSSIAVSGSTTFIITFTPQAAGPRSAIVSIANNDSNENPYTYLINGTGVCLATANTITPTSGPVGTEVTITATANNLSGATVTFNGTNATPVTQVSSTQIKVTVPSGASTGNLVTTNAQGCTATNAFTVLTNLAQPCEGGYIPTDLFISEFTDSNSGSLSYVEIYNGTGVTKNLSNYSLKTANNGGAYLFTLPLNNVNLASGSSYVVALGDDDFCAIAGGDGSYAAQISASGSVNFTANQHDHVGLFNGVTLIDSWGTFGSNNWGNALGIGTEGADFRRNTNVVAPNATYSNSDWTIIDYAGTTCSNNDYSNIGTYSMTLGVAPTVTVHPSYTPTCRSTSLTVAGTEGFVGGNALAYQWYAVAPNTATWTALTDGGLYSGTTTLTLSISDIATLIGYQFYCQIRENSATCYAASNAVMITAGITTTWQAGNTWSSGVPTLDTAVIIDNTYDTANGYSPSFEACSVTVNNARNVIVRGNHYILIKNGLTVTGTGTATFENNASLVQINNVTNSGNITYKRKAVQRRVDYVYWSSPVDGYSLSTLPSDGYKFRWDTTLNNANGTQGNWVFYTGAMNPGTGYIVGGPSSLSNTVAGDFEVPFSGVPRNGNIPVTISRGSYVGPGYTVGTTPVTTLDDNWNLLGNPYPSAISCRDFLTANSSALTGALYIWTHGTMPSINTSSPFYQDFISNYDPNADYLPFNLSGNLANPNPDFYIGAGQGFFVVMQDGAAGSTTVNFTNALRNKNYGNVTGTNFYRLADTAAMEPQALPFNRIWLDIVKDTQRPSRTMFGYIEGATMEKDHLYDAITKSDNSLKMYTVAGGDKFIIQGRSLPFDEYDQVPLGVDIPENGTYKIAVGMVDGLFQNEDQKIYLEDTYLNIIHNLREAPYQFAGVPGTYTDRFKIRYTTDALANPDFDTLENSVIVTSNHGVVTLHSAIQNMTQVWLYDVLGRQLFAAKDINSQELTATNISVSQQSLIVKIQLESGVTVTKKIVIQ
ncbi:choice-of-anchor D domain-containing protein [Flavobacterium sedimenticola]|uniref:Choice-of-anchor D domain-containing protein n=1 Tax=Flavobacterium sedimenticola TaxID=3043286 RepID=A0ABT6XN55_9FLAO|nr:choice-of-anchor D domain-containing protein [Flavobacterium sedimenticola]MDI9256292.1 choice-of-anchor D domain-containing protein [Flavobacterium sedimenticola]